MSDYQYVESKVHTPDSVYPFDWNKAIEGYDVLAFDAEFESPDEYYYLANSGTVRLQAAGKSALIGPRLFLKKKQPKRFVFEECSREESKTINNGCWLRFNDGEILISYSSHNSAEIGKAVYVKPVEVKS